MKNNETNNKQHPDVKQQSAKAFSKKKTAVINERNRFMCVVLINEKINNMAIIIIRINHPFLKSQRTLS